MSSVPWKNRTTVLITTSKEKRTLKVSKDIRNALMKNKVIIPREKILEWYEEEYSNGGTGSIYGPPKKQLLSFFDILEKNNVKSVLELGCGDGRNLFELAKRGFYSTGVDLVGKIVVEKNAKENKLDHLIEFIEADITQLTLNKKFDAVICSEVLHLIEREYLQRIMEKMDSFLSGGGFIYVDILTELKRTFAKTKEEFEYADQPNYTSNEIKDFFEDYFKDWDIIEVSAYSDKQSWPLKKGSYPLPQYIWEGVYVCIVSQKPRRNRERDFEKQR